MAEFTGSGIETLDYNFAAWGGGKGTVPEPDDSQIEAWVRGLAALQLEDDPNAEPAADDDRAWARRMVDRPEGERLDKAKKIAAVYADLCSHTPSTDELIALPPRVRAAFYTWLSTQFRPG